ncbi:helix-turn-helix domain-containing protein [Macrococcus armenti]|uniref:helix-turn-helix domain-containing protein n=1 Tax=Macrococcus armenti TaxID=2875764 RepID=UPI001CCF14BE|nr:helix-turn-helix domain-containing protein [Macrococcus armenti]UBH15018.1 helix-turn-helix domain-containing protein [Macrococcus armenti]UBH17377.1 helix-turn-helix domain-containing protein [Macrococcus armenti]UBH19642.1 helix-turn-helix domain-containing protein [Macrococcus armenti]
MSFLTVKEVSEIIRSSEKYTYKLIKKGIIPAIKLEGKILVDSESLQETLSKMNIEKEED